MSKSQAQSVVSGPQPALEALEERVLLASTELVSVSSGGALGNNASRYSAVSADGRYVAFGSDAANLVSGDTNGKTDIFVRNRLTGATRRISISSSGAQANDNSYGLSLSANGRYVAFASFASNLVPGDTNAEEDVFVRDRKTGTTERVSIKSEGTQGNNFSLYPSLSADGRYVAFMSMASNLSGGDTNGTYDAFVHDRQTGKTERVSVRSNGAQANGQSLDPSLSANGRYVAFASEATNLVSGDTNGRSDIFVRDRQAHTTARVSLRSNGAQANGGSYSPSVSADGRYVAFMSEADNLVPGDTNGDRDIFVHDRQAHTTVRASARSDGAQSLNGESFNPSLSADGRYVAFESLADNLVAGDTNGAYDIFVRDLQTDKTRRASIRSGGGQSDGHSYAPHLSADGMRVAFDSLAGNLVSGDTNGQRDVFVRVL